MGNERTTGSQGPTTGQQRAPRETPGGGLGAVRIWLLDGFRISVGSSGSIGKDEWRLKKAGSLLKLLALAPAHRLHREQAMDLLWPELDSGAAANKLHHALHIARRTLEPSAPGGAASGYLHLRGESLALSPAGPVWVDVEAFEEAATTARHALEPAAYRAAIDLYSGELLPQDRYEVWAEDRRAQLRRVYLSLLLEVAGLYEERKEFGRAIEALGSVVTEDPTHEGAQVGLIQLYALLGRRREALRQYERLRDALFREFGTEPEAATVRLHEQSLELFREIRNTQGIITCLGHLGLLALIRGDYESAPTLLRESLRLAWELDYKQSIQHCLYTLACVSACLEQPVRAARLWGAVEGMEEAYSAHLTPIILSLTNYEDNLSRSRSQLGEEGFAEAWAGGKAMSLGQTIEYAHSDEEELEPPTLVPEQQPPPDERTERLTRREREVALLVARGLTNRQIASVLSVSRNTANNHVARILRKLGLRSRAQIAAWVTERRSPSS